MKQHTLVLIILIFIATTSSVAVLASEGYFNKKKAESKILSKEEQSISKPIALAPNTASTKKPTIAKSSTTVQKAPVKKAPVKKAAPKKKVVAKKKSKLNLAPSVITPATAPYSAKR
ncbi:MAG: hypothetical protein WC241_03810 [Candidatus Paceibacterota bacterium]